MPSASGDFKQGLQGKPKRVLEEELRAIPLTESLRSQVQVLTVRRREAYVQARAYRVGGHLVPGSLGQEMAENGAELENALKRYAEATGGDSTTATRLLEAALAARITPTRSTAKRSRKGTSA